MVSFPSRSNEGPLLAFVSPRVFSGFDGTVLHSHTKGPRRHLRDRPLAKLDAVVAVVEAASEEELSFVEAGGSSLLLTRVEYEDC